MKQKNVSGYLFSAAFFLLLIVIASVTVWRPKEQFSYYENRNLAEKPSFSVGALLDGSYFTEWETAFCDHAAFRTTVMKMETWTDINLLHRPVVNDVVVTDDEVLLTYNEYEAVNESDLLWHADQIGQQLETLNEYIESYGGTFLYVAVPCHYAYYENLYPSYLNNRSAYTEAETDAFFDALASRGISYLDLGPIWEAEGNPGEYMSTVDHHYTWAGCFSAYQAVMAYINNLSGNCLQILSNDDLILTTLPNPYLGSRARKLCGQWESEEKLVYGTLGNPLPFSRYNWSNDTPAYASMVTLPSTDWEDVNYGVYMGGDISETIIQTDRPELPSLLVYGDSFTNAMETLLYVSFDEMISLDLRYYKTMSLLEYVEEYQPEIVLCIRDYEQLLSLDGNGTVL